MVEQFRKWLIRENLSQNTVCSYTFAVKHYYSIYKEITKENLLNYKVMLIKNYRCKTVNLRILGINKYLDFIGESTKKLKLIKIQEKNFLENVISNSDYIFLKNQLKENNNMQWYFVVRFLAATGARVSELVEMKVEDVLIGYIDIYSKGGKIRRIYIAEELQKEAIEWLRQKNKTSGYLFCNRQGHKLTTRGIAHQLKKLAGDFKMNLKVIYPHSFRHRFAKNFLEKHNDIALLADLMGHESIETTRIYLRKTSEEQRKLIDEIITW